MNEKYSVFSDWNASKGSFRDSTFDHFLNYKSNLSPRVYPRRKKDLSPEEKSKLVEPTPASIPVPIPGNMSIGPASYSPVFSITRPKVKSASFGKSQRFNDLNYEEPSSLPQIVTSDKAKKPLQNWFFRSTSKRIEELIADASLPGPGHYDVKNRKKPGCTLIQSGIGREKAFSTDPHRPFMTHLAVTPPIGAYQTRDDLLKMKQLATKLRPPKSKLKVASIVKKRRENTTDHKFNSLIL